MLNVSKTKCVLFDRLENSCNIIKLQVANEEIECVNEFKFLGFWLDRTMSFSKHYVVLYDQLSKLSFVTRKLATFIPSECIKTLYYAHYFSRLSYGISVWFPHLREPQKHKLRQLQKRLVRIICKKTWNVHCIPLFKSQGLLVIDDLVRLLNIKLIHRTLNGTVPRLLHSLFLSKGHMYETCRESFTIPRFKYKICHDSFLVQSIKDWDALINDVKCKTNVKSVAKAFKRFVLNKY